MPHLEPTYLRYIYDGLVKGSIHPENAAELPEGLIGLYEESFDESQAVQVRQKLLERFAIWALLKKEVSAAFVADVLGESEDEIQDFISKYSAWFNSPESGKYQLYHERLKVYLLQKLSEGEVAKLNNLIVDFLLQKVNEVKHSESLSYCFENLSFHLYLKGYLTGDSDLLAQYCLDDTFKKRQFDLSGFYDWEEKMMVFGVEYFSLKQDQICHQLVFEKTKIQHKSKDVNLLLELVKTNKFEILFSLFKSLIEIELEERIASAYLYILTFFEIFELENKNFQQKKDIANQLLVIFEEHFQWDKGYYLAQFIDINLSFRLHCYFVQFGLDFKKYAVLSSDHKTEFYGLDIRYDELKFIDPIHKEEAIYILKHNKTFDYGFKDDQIFNLIDELTNNSGINKGLKYCISLDDNLTFNLTRIGKTKLLKGDDLIEIVENDIQSFDELVSCIKFILKMKELTSSLKRDFYLLVDKVYSKESNGQIEIIGSWRQGDLKVQKRNLLSTNKELKSLPELISDGLVIEEFMSMEPNKRFKLLKDENLDSNEDIELMLFFIELSEYYQKEEPNDLINILSVLLIEFHLNMNDELIDGYIDELLDLISSSIEASEEFENKIFIQLLEFLNRTDINGQLKKTLISIHETVLETYFDFSFYKYSFVAGCQLINLFSRYKVDFPENEILDRILDDLNNLIEENDYNEMWVIEMSRINQIYQKPYFWEFYNSVKRINIEQVRENLAKYIFEDILLHKGTNYNTVIFFKENSNEYPNMYLWAKKRLSLKLLEKNEELSYVVIKDNNDLLLERLLLNIVSKRENLKDEHNIQILKHYGLDWVIELDNEYEKLISTN
jgi:hypothetical protein